LRGMHHLAALFDFDSRDRTAAEETGIKTMKPFRTSRISARRSRKANGGK